MKKIFAFLIGTMLTFACQANLPKWVISPANDTLFVKIDNELIQGNVAGKSYIWTMDGVLLYSTENTILPFKDGVATVILKDKPIITGLINKDGKFISLQNVEVAYNNPFFENGLILCKDGHNLVFYKNDGTKANFQEVEKAYPFHKGFAPFLMYEQPEKKKDPHYGYFKADGKPIYYKVADKDKLKPIDPKDIDFVSGIGSTGKGVAVIKDKIYWFDPTTEIFEPFLRGNEKSIKKRHLNVEGDYEEFFLNIPQDTIVIQAKYGKDQFGVLKFDEELRPVLFSFEDGEIVFAEKTPSAFEYNSDVSEYEENNLYGLSMGSERILPPQFEKIGLKYDNKAFVKTNGKWGIIEIVPNLKYTLELNKGQHIAFRHQKFETQLRLDLPAQISAKEARIDVSGKTGCSIDKTSRECKDTESGNFVTYNCVLTIPKQLPDTIKPITYESFSISYDGISLFEVPLTIKAWHLKYYNVDPIESETSITNGVASFTLNINAQRNVGETDYPFDVRVEADSLSVEHEKISETRYKCIVSNLREGDNSINIYVTEEGCPSSVFPFDIYYTKPVPRKKKKEEVVIRKRDKSKPKDSNQPRLDLE